MQPKECIFNNNYLIYPDGKVWSKQTQRFIKGDTNNIGYKRVIFCPENKRYFIHRLVAIHFVENPNKLPIVNHLDGNKLNNDYTNLEWCSRSDNDKHAYKLGLRKCNLKQEVNRKPVGQYDKKGNLINTFKSATEAANHIGGTAPMIRRVCQKHRKYAYNYNWRYLSK
jgi:hypothetical protein